MQFVCAHSFRGYQNSQVFDATFLEFPPLNPKKYSELKSKISLILDPHEDKLIKLKKQENKYGIFFENYKETTIDWILILNNQHIDIWQV